MELRKLAIPDTFEEIVKVYRDYKRQVFDGWCNMHYHELKVAKTSMQQQCNSMMNSKDPHREIKACIGLRLLGKLHPIHLTELLQKLASLMPCSDDVSAMFVAFITAKFCRRHYLKDLRFVVTELQRCHEWLSEKDLNTNANNALHLMYWFAQFASSAVLSSSQQFMDTLALGYYHESVDVRLRSFDIGSAFLERSKKGILVLSVFNKALQLLKESTSVSGIHGSLLVLISYAKTYPDLAAPYAKALMSSCRFATRHSDTNISSAALTLLIHMAPLDPIEYRNKHASAVLSMFANDAPVTRDQLKCLLPLMCYFPEQFIGKGGQIVAFVEGLLEAGDDDVAFDLILRMGKDIPQDLAENLERIAQALEKAPLSGDLVTTVLQLCQIIPSAWDLCKESLGCRFVENIREKSAQLPMILGSISKCPHFGPDVDDELFELVHPLLNDPNPAIRQVAPGALLTLNDRIYDESYSVLLNEVLSLAVSESCSDVRLAILNSLNPPYSPYLLYPKSIECFSVLVNDESFKIRKVTLTILGTLAEMNPSMILPIFRRVLLDALFICDSSPLLRLQAETTRCLTVIIESAGPILPVYIPVFIPIALSYLRLRFVHVEPECDIEEVPFVCQHLPVSVSFHEAISDQPTLLQRGTQQTYFELEYSTRVAVNFIDTIALSFRKQHDLLEAQYVEITNLFLKILEMSSHKLIAIAVLKALTYIFEFLGPTAVNEFPTLLQTLFDLGSRFTSSKIHALIFKVYGNFGPLSPVLPIEDHFDRDQVEIKKLSVSEIGSQISISDWNLSISAAALLHVLEDDTQSDLHYQCFEILSNWPLDASPIVRPFFHKFVVYLLNTVRSAPSDEKDQYFPLLKKILRDHKEWLKPFAANFARLIESLMDGSAFIRHALSLTPEIVKSLGESFAPYIPKIVAMFLDTLFNTETTHPQLACEVLMTLTHLSTFASDYVFIILRQMAEIVFNPVLKTVVVLAALQAMNVLVQEYDCSSYSSLLVRSCFHCCMSQDENVRVGSVQLLTSLSRSMGDRFRVYKERAKIQLAAAGLLTEKVKQEFLDDGLKTDSSMDPDLPITEDPGGGSPVTDDIEIQEEELLKSAVLGDKLSSGQWKDWCRRFVLTVIYVAPSKVLRDCYPLAQASYSFAVRLFHSAFLSCWAKLSETGKNTVCDSFAKALADPGTPMFVLTTIVGLAEFMERADQHLRISYKSLTAAALRAEKLPFALYCEQRDESSTTAKTEQLISIYSQLALDDDVHGLINSLRHTPDIEMTPKLAELLGDWEKAISLYKNIGSQESLSALLRSLSMVNDWESIAALYKQTDNLPATFKTQNAHYFAGAFARLKDWPSFENAIRYAEPDSVEALIIQCLANHERGLGYGDLIQTGFKSLGVNAGPLFQHGYSSLVPFLVQAEQLVELQEAANNSIQYWAARNKPDRLTFQQMQPLLNMRIQLLGNEHAQNEILALLKLTRNSGEWGLYDHFFKIYYPEFDLEKSNSHVIFEYCMSLWKRRQKRRAVEVLYKLIDTKLMPMKDPLVERGLAYLSRWIVRADYNQQSLTSLLEAARICQLADPSNHKAFLYYAWTQLKLYNMKEGDREHHAIEAIKGLIKCANGIAEMMQLCSIVFRAGKFTRVFKAIEKDLNGLDLVLWLPLIPQLFAQLTNPSSHLAEFAQKTVWRSLLEHHHTVIFSLLFCVGFSRESQEIGRQMQEKYRQLQPDIVENSYKIYVGLLSACWTKTETWHDALATIGEYFKQDNIAEMKAVFEANMAKLKMENCDADLLFNRVYADKIRKVEQIFRFFFVSRTKKHCETIWKDIRELKDAMKADIDSMNSIPLKFVAPTLAEIKDVDIAVPGTYSPGMPINTIARFASSMDVFPSKQRPKRFAIIGKDGREFWYLLKGREDLRLDQRFVQLFELINSFIPAEMPKIVTNFIMPLSPKTGVIQWVPGSDTMFKLIREYRSARGISTDLELKSMCSKSIVKLDALRPIQRLEILKEVAVETPDTVLADIMWLKAPNSETWVKRMCTFSRTSGLMSVVGYLLGLGDRHTSNIMIHKFTGSVIHVDFGDCFEISKERVLFPELIPFRLTRFIVKAFGPSGIDGAFRKSCLDMISLLRGRREDIMSVLEIFAHAPVVRNVSEPTDKQDTSSNDEDENVARVISRVNDKIIGLDFESRVPLTQEDQVSELINAATDMYKMAHLYHGWKPLW